jgi:hypothetical protein
MIGEYANEILSRSSLPSDRKGAHTVCGVEQQNISLSHLFALSCSRIT